MKLKKLYIITLVLLLVAALSFSCASKTSSTTQQVATVKRGTLSVDVSASGNLAFSKTADLAFDVSGYVYRVLVEEGDTVTKGQLVADVDEFDWDKEKESLERAAIQAQVSLNSAQISLEDTQNPTTTTSTISGAISAPDPLEVESKQLQVEIAKMALDSAQKELARYLETSYQILAPFDGFITSVNVEGGDEIYKGAVAVSMADPTKFKADIYISEVDINQIEVGMAATVQLTTSTTSKFPAKVTAIAPTATNSSGVINYKVQVELLSTEETKQLLASQAQATKPSTSGQVLSGQVPSGQPPSGQPPSGQSSNQTTTRSSTSAASAPLTLEDLRDGLSATITITVQEKQNVLMVPSKAVTRQGVDKVVKIPKGETTEIRVVKTGLSNSTYTEITEGLSEGETVVTGTTSSTTSTTKSTTSSIGGMMGGMGGPPP